jgi:hypothetical protein
MAEPASAAPPMAGKGKRVVGTFLVMLGAGLVIESTLHWLGGALMLGGAAALVRGALDARPSVAAASHQPVAIDAHSEGRP